MIGPGWRGRKDRRREDSCLGWGSFGGSPPRAQVQHGRGFGPSEARGAWMPLHELRGEGAAGERGSAWNTWGLDSEAEPGPLGPLEECRLRDGRGWLALTLSPCRSWGQKRKREETKKKKALPRPPSFVERLSQRPYPEPDVSARNSGHKLSIPLAGEA